MVFYVSVVISLVFLQITFGRVVFDDHGNVAVSGNEKIQLLSLRPEIFRKLGYATTNYVESRGDADQWDKKFEMDAEGLLCLFRVRVDNFQSTKGTIRLLTVAEGPTVLKGLNIKIQGAESNFRFSSIPADKIEDTDIVLRLNKGLTVKEALKIGKDYISDSIMKALNDHNYLKDYVSAGFSAHLIEGIAHDGNGTGTFIFFAVLFSKQ